LADEKVGREGWKGKGKKRRVSPEVRKVASPRSALLLSVSNSNDALALRVPGNILDLTGDNLDLNLQGVLLLGGVPNADISKGV